MSAECEVCYQEGMPNVRVAASPLGALSVGACECCWGFQPLDTIQATYSAVDGMENAAPWVRALELATMRHLAVRHGRTKFLRRISDDDEDEFIFGEDEVFG